jgi:Sphingolipid Delta4-desaturase (DES)
MATGRPDYMEDPVGQKFHWVTSGEPHAMRRREILAKYGSEVRKLYGYDHKTAWVVSFLTTSYRNMSNGAASFGETQNNNFLYYS